MTKRAFFASVSLLLFLLLVFLSGPVQADTPLRPVKIGVLAHRGAASALTMWGPTAAYLTTNIPSSSFAIVPLGFHEIGPAVARGEVDFVLANSSLYVELEARHGVNRIATLRNNGWQGGHTAFGGVIFCRADRREINSFDDLPGKSFLAVDEASLGGWQVAWRELKASGLDPYRDFSPLRFAETTHDEVVYAVRDGKADAGTVRTDTLERLAAEGKIELSAFRILNPRQEQSFPYLLSTRLYPEWPLAATAHTDLELAEQVAVALLKMPHDSPAAKAGKMAGWTIPLDYQPVHELLKELRLGPYQDYGKITLRDVVRLYWFWLVLAGAALLVMIALTWHVLRLNRRMVCAKQLVEEARNGLEQEVRQRTGELQAANAELRISGALSQAVHDNVEIGIAVIGPDMRIQSLNRRMRQWFPHIDPALKPVCHQAFNIPPLAAPCSYCPTIITLADGKSHEAVTDTPTPFGVRNYRVVSSPLLAADGSVEAVIEVVEDITERRKGEAALRQLSCVVEQSPASIIITDPTGVIEYVNPGFCELTGYSAAEVLGQSPRILQSGHTPSAEYGRLWATIRAGGTWHGEFCNKKKNGAIYWEAATITPIRDETGAISQIVAIKEDITLRKEAENALRNAKAEWERTFDAITDPVMVLDTNFRIVKANQAMATALGVTPARAVGMTCYESVHGTQAPPGYCPHAKLLVDGQARSQEIYEPRLGGHYLINVSPLHGADGALIGSIHAARDISELKKAEELSRQYSRDLERLLAISRETTMTTDLKGLYRAFVSAAKELLNLDFSTLMLLSDDKTTLVMQDTLGFPESMIGHFSVVEGTGLATLLVKNKRAETVADFIGETRFEIPPIVWEKGIRSAVGVPMMMNDEILGVLIGHTLTRRDFSQNEIEIFQLIANQAAVAIRNATNAEMLRKNEKYVRDVTAALGEGVYVLNSLGNVTFMNPEAERLLGWREEELFHKNIHDVIHNRRVDGAPLAFADCEMRKVIETGNRFQSTTEQFSKKDGTSFPVAVYSTPLLEEGQVVASVTAFRDISERVRLEKEREQLVAQLQQALADIKTLHGIVPICASCKKIRDDKGAWHQMEVYISKRTDAQFSHGICKDCAKKLYPEIYGDETSETI